MLRDAWWCERGRDASEEELRCTSIADAISRWLAPCTSASWTRSMSTMRAIWGLWGNSEREKRRVRHRCRNRRKGSNRRSDDWMPCNLNWSRTACEHNRRSHMSDRQEGGRTCLRQATIRFTTLGFAAGSPEVSASASNSSLRAIIWSRRATRSTSVLRHCANMPSDGISSSWT